MKVKYRKCPDCGERMNMKDSSKGKFWGCTGYPDCRKTLPWHGDKPKTGLDLEIRAIDNGYLIALRDKYVDDPSDEEINEIYCKELEGLAKELYGLFKGKTATLIAKLKANEGFEEEIDEEHAKKRSKVAKQGETDIAALLKKVGELERKKDK